jgi:hypothetical protein
MLQMLSFDVADIDVEATDVGCCMQQGLQHGSFEYCARGWREEAPEVRNMLVTHSQHARNISHLNLDLTVDG